MASRISAWVTARTRLFERQAPYRQAGNLMLSQSESMRQHRAQHRALYREGLRRTFTPELMALPVTSRGGLFEALAAVADWDFWESLRG